MRGCYSPHPQGGLCATTPECPPGLACVDGICGGTPTDATHPDADPSCTCTIIGDLACASGTVSCALGCDASAPAHCEHLVPSNGVRPDLVDDVSDEIDISADTTFDTDDGSISGSLMRDPGEGVIAGIEYVKVGSMGVFVVGSLQVASGKTLKFRGTRSAVLLSADDVEIAGVLDVAAEGTNPGPGGGAGAIYSAVPGGCAPGGPGVKGTTGATDSGGGGGGGGRYGAAGGTVPTAIGGVGGIDGCVTNEIVPLVGGSGGGGGGPGVTIGASGGAGGGALQISVNGTLSFGNKSGINGAGGGGRGGLADANGVNAGGGGGGGGGASLLLEAIELDASSMAIFAANGGGGGGGGNADTIGQPGQNGRLSLAAAAGGAGGGGAATSGGVGGIASTPPGSPPDGGDTANGGGGGGGGGRFRINTKTGATQTVTASPAPTWGVVQVK